MQYGGQCKKLGCWPLGVKKVPDILKLGVMSDLRDNEIFADDFIIYLLLCLTVTEYRQLVSI